MEIKALDDFFRSFSVELPNHFQTMDQYLDFILPKVRPWSEDLYEQQYYLNTRWLEVRDDNQFHEAILHIFQAEGAYMRSVDGNISNGNWQLLPRSNTMILNRVIDDTVVQSELFDLAFLNADFFILKKHGDQTRKGQKKYFVMAKETRVRRLQWRDTMELLFNNYRGNSQFIVYVVIIVLIVAIFVVLSVF